MTNQQQSNVEQTELTHRTRDYLKLIELYKEHECLWKQNSPDFFNFELKEKTWEEIAEKMCPDSAPEKWKHIIYKLRYNVALEKLHEQEVRFYNICEECPSKKLVYEEKLLFLNHAFKNQPKITNPNKPSVPIESLLAKCMRLGHNKVRMSYTAKLKALEGLRNARANPLILTPEAFRKLQRSIGETEVQPIKKVHALSFADQ